MKQGDRARALQVAPTTVGKMVEEMWRKAKSRLLGLAQGVGDWKLYFEFIYYCFLLWQWTELKFYSCNI